MKSDIINSESTKMTRKCKVGLCMPYQVDNNKSFHLVRVTCVYLLIMYLSCISYKSCYCLKEDQIRV